MMEVLFLTIDSWLIAVSTAVICYCSSHKDALLVDFSYNFEVLFCL